MQVESSNLACCRINEAGLDRTHCLNRTRVALCPPSSFSTIYPSLELNTHRHSSRDFRYYTYYTCDTPRQLLHHLHIIAPSFPATMADSNEQQQPPASVDETPISPVRRPDHERKNSLENHLMHRPDRTELVGSKLPRTHLLIAAYRSLYANQGVAENILPASTAAPGLQSHQRDVS